MTGKIRVLLAEDQAMVHGALAALLRLEEDLEVVADVGRGDEVVPAALESQPDVALLDIENLFHYPTIHFRFHLEQISHLI